MFGDNHARKQKQWSAGSLHNLCFTDTNNQFLPCLSSPTFAVRSTRGKYEGRRINISLVHSLSCVMEWGLLTLIANRSQLSTRYLNPAQIWIRDKIMSTTPLHLGAIAALMLIPIRLWLLIFKLPWKEEVINHFLPDCSPDLYWSM